MQKVHVKGTQEEYVAGTGEAHHDVLPRDSKASSQSFSRQLNGAIVICVLMADSEIWVIGGNGPERGRCSEAEKGSGVPSALVLCLSRVLQQEDKVATEAEHGWESMSQ